VLAVAPGHEPTFFAKVDPQKGPLTAVLKSRVNTRPSSQTILGRVVDRDGKPIPQAVVSVETTVMGNTYHGWPPEGTDPLAVTDENGEFSIGSPVKFDAMMFSVQARALARGIFNDVKPGSARHELVVTEGAAITGRVLGHGQPLKDVVTGACGSDRSIGNFTGDFVMACQADGRFLLPNLPPNREYFLYGIMNSLTNYGTLPLKRVKPGGDGQTLDVGDLAVVPGKRLAGRVELSDRMPLPSGTRLTVGREDAWDVLALLLPSDGQFDISNLPSGETLNLNVALKGYRPSPRNASFEALNGFGLTGTLPRDKTNLVFRLEPGQVQPGRFEDGPEEDQPRNFPLGGIETQRVHAAGWVISGRALDAETKQALAGFEVVPGDVYEPRSRWIRWLTTRTAQASNGVFSVDVPRQTRFAILQAEANGYLPARSVVLEPGQTTWTFQLHKGAGPSGVLLNADGQPAPGVTVCYLGPGEQTFLSSEGEMQDPRVSQTKTDGQGKFSFPPKFGDTEIIAAGPLGFVRSPANQLKSSGQLRLTPWAKLKGRLVQNGKPVANENLDLRWAGGFDPTRPYLNLGGVKTDDDGRFAFGRVPPGSLEITTRQRLGENHGGWSSIPQKKVTAVPGTELDLGDVEKSEANSRASAR
jgi:hypothetical protein